MVLIQTQFLELVLTAWIRLRNLANNILSDTWLIDKYLTDTFDRLILPKLPSYGTYIHIQDKTTIRHMEKHKRAKS